MAATRVAGQEPWSAWTCSHTQAHAGAHEHARALRCAHMETAALHVRTRSARGRPGALGAHPGAADSHVGHARSTRANGPEASLNAGGPSWYRDCPLTVTWDRVVSSRLDSAVTSATWSSAVLHTQDGCTGVRVCGRAGVRACGRASAQVCVWGRVATQDHTSTSGAAMMWAHVRCPLLSPPPPHHHPAPFRSTFLTQTALLHRTLPRSLAALVSPCLPFSPLRCPPTRSTTPLAPSRPRSRPHRHGHTSGPRGCSHRVRGLGSPFDCRESGQHGLEGGRDARVHLRA